MPSLISFRDSVPPNPSCDQGGDEHFFDAIADAFSPDLLGGHNAGFLRPDAHLVVVLLNADGEDDSFEGSGINSADQLVAQLQALKSDPSLVRAFFSRVLERLSVPPTPASSSCC